MSKRNWVKDYGVRKLQEGGQMAPPPQEGAPQEGGGANLDAMVQEYAQTRDPQLAVAIADGLVEMLAAQGGGAPAGPEGGAPMARNGAKLPGKGPVFKK